jgi:DNA repair protein RadA/Sms
MPGTPNQLREAAVTFMEACKQSGVPLFVTGHITRDGTVAGPKTLEHMVDCVLYFDSDRINHYRLLRAIKNRFGPVGEVAIFLMEKDGLREVRSPEMQGRPEDQSPGRIHSALMEGSRPIAAEVQALVVRAGGPPRRMADGVDTRRMILISAVIEKYLKADLSVCDIFANLAGGLNSQDPSLDLAMAAAILSSYLEITPPPFTAFCGEVGLSGEVRSVGMLDRRIKELLGLGFKKIVVPKDASLRNLQGSADIEIIEVTHIGAVRDLLRG